MTRYTDQELLDDSPDKLGEIGRIGSFSLVIFSIISFAASVLLPFLVMSPDKKDRRDFDSSKMPKPVARFAKFLRERKPRLLTTWFISHLIFAAAQLCAPFVRSVGFATVIVATAGIPWALAMWAPFAFMGVEINKLASPNYHTEDENIALSGSTGGYHQTRLNEPESEHRDDPDYDSNEREHLTHEKSADDEEAEDSEEEKEELHLHHNIPTKAGEDIDEDDLELAPGELLTQVEADLDDASTGETAGVYMGILNLYAAAPQLLGTVINMIIFAIVEPGRNPELTTDVTLPSPPGMLNGTTSAISTNNTMPYSLRPRTIELWHRDEVAKPPIVNAIAVCMFIGGLSSLGAAYATWRLRHVY